MDDRLIVARISGITSRYTGRHVLTEDDRAGALTELAEIAGDRPDLLAQHAGLCLGAAEGGLDLLAPQYRLQAELAIAAGADETLIGRWREAGRQRAEAGRALRQLAPRVWPAAPRPRLPGGNP